MRVLSLALLLSSLAVCGCCGNLSAAPKPPLAAIHSGGDALARAPYMGWTTWNLQDVHLPQYNNKHWLNATNVRAQADLMHRLLQPHGYDYVNIDSGWAGPYDMYGRPLPDLKKFPGGIAALARDFHKRGQKIGIYWIPGVQRSVYENNPPIYGTKYHVRDIVAQPPVAGNAFGDWHMKIDFHKPGAQEFIDSITRLFASWGIDYLKLDGVGPGSDSEVDSRDDVRAYSEGLRKTGRPIWLEVSWRLDHQHAAFWQKYAQGRRINDDIDSLTPKITGWSQIMKRFQEAPLWSEDAGPGKGWNDFDSLPIGNGSMDGLTESERRLVMTFWAINCAPLYNGDDLSKLDSFGLKLLTNDEVIALDQAAHPAVPMVGGAHQVWRADNGDGSYTVALLNLGAEPATVAADWSFLGLASVQPVRDLWSYTDLGPQRNKFQAMLPPHSARLIRVGRPSAVSQRTPLAISGLKASSRYGGVQLSWNASASASRYIVRRSRSAHSGFQVLNARVTQTGYLDRPAADSAPYYYQIAAANGAGASAMSQPVGAAPAREEHDRVISIDFTGDAIAMDQDEVAGVVPAMHWNTAPCRYGGLPLVDSAGYSSGAWVQYDAGGTFATPIPDTAGGNRMMRGYLETYGHDTTKITVSLLPPLLAKYGYDVYVYCDGGNIAATRTGKFTIGDQSVEVTDNAGSFYSGAYAPASASGANYVKFSVAKGDTFTLLATPVSSTDENLRAPINGIQIVPHAR
ncbi:hypothetical protein CCAX7_21460 [Capsulimonas corticalis]|uniref:Alpha-galactosidase n=1 Tax=Capsulimonas corticalis TaxID=2219043 RepID=A0A402D1Z6_9BACT|nr:glycoside hydrolase family 27 protein [Capsulimonas corticalis]BDI30095.1 hypothetical protein CCAX7_21460 [Capsulimonas corticalis]